MGVWAIFCGPFAGRGLCLMDLGGGSTEFWSANRLRLLCCPSTRPPCLSGS